LAGVSNHPIESFDSLLRNLLTYDLVEQDDGRWVLRPFAARRLSELADSSPQHARVSVYIGYLCERCHAAGITRAFEGQRLCDACIEAASQRQEDAPMEAGSEASPPARAQRGGRLVARYRTTGALGRPSKSPAGRASGTEQRGR
jgi:hypothetical protein